MNKLFIVIVFALARGALPWGLCPAAQLPAKSKEPQTLTGEGRVNYLYGTITTADASIVQKAAAVAKSAESAANALQQTANAATSGTAKLGDVTAAAQGILKDTAKAQDALTGPGVTYTLEVRLVTHTELKPDTGVEPKPAPSEWVEKTENPVVVTCAKGKSLTLVYNNYKNEEQKSLGFSISQEDSAKEQKAYILPFKEVPKPTFVSDDANCKITVTSVNIAGAFVLLFALLSLF